ncbi:MAG: cation diffusion facilitator family transporter, partial [Polyangiales bacterium]
MSSGLSDPHARSARQVGRDRAVARVLWLVLSLNLGVAAIKFVVAWATGTVALFADAIHTVLDGSANLVGIVGIVAATKPADDEHPYGHRRYETIAAMGIGLLIASGLIGVLHGIWGAITGDHPPPRVTWATGCVVAFTVLVNLFITRYERTRGRQLQSSLLTADASHMLADTFGALAVLGAFVGVALHI